jgi:hypothetical protein
LIRAIFATRLVSVTALAGRTSGVGMVQAVAKLY